MTQPDLAEDVQAVVIKSSVWKLLWLIILFGTLLVMVLGAIPSMAAWFGMLFLGALLPIALYIYRPSASYLRLHANGLDIAAAGRKRTIHWSDVIGFHLHEERGDKLIGILYSDACIQRNATQPWQTQDADAEWIRDLYAMPMQELCDTLNRWAARKKASFCQGGLPTPPSNA